ncbi:MAG: GDP-L-fucose synthase [Elusimicrobia bacterium]|nr:GDP-L-fucose synthase [Elusimicrobiota bacterium]
MDRDCAIYVSGHAGLVGSALVRLLRRKGFRRVVTRSRRRLDLTDRAAVERFFRSCRPRYVFHAAAEVGGISANSSRPADFIYQNLAIQTNVIDAAHRHGVERLIFFGSSCAYPKSARVPIREDSLLTGALEPTNEPYAVAKIAGLKMCQAYNRQYGSDFLTVVPANLYGPGDHFAEDGHVVAGLMRRFHEAKVSRSPGVTLWGSGRPRRDFLYVDDLAEACLFLMRRAERLPCDLINIGSGRETSVRDLARSVLRVVGYRGRIAFDASRPDGAPRRFLDSRRIVALGWRPRTALAEGLRLTYAWYRRTRASRP